MDAKAVATVNRFIHQKFPEMDGVQPKVRAQSISKGTGEKNAGHDKTSSYLLTYQSQVRTSNGKTLSLWVRVVADSEGKIIKISSSR